MRAHQLPPLFKLYVLNNEEAFFGFYSITEHPVTLDGESVPIYDVLGKDASLFHFTTSEDDTSNGPRYVQEARAWFESVWTTLAQVYKL
ncbi:hypothetical protein [Actinopolymorpha alba]|uniref:hypothetical protein n=1 Tax=Actinopolymorpha alba TaxID=533267 RepID=UPI0003736226|nr:hypothetical protein [Actinopolymorpha alba]